MRIFLLISISIFFLSVLTSTGCKNKSGQGEKPTAQTMNEFVTDGIKEIITAEPTENKTFADNLKFLPALTALYEQNNFTPLWSSNEKPKPLIDSFLNYFNSSVEDGIFPSDYGIKRLKDIYNTIIQDSVARTKAALWVETDIRFSAALLNVIYDLKYGRLLPDALSYKKNHVFYDSVLYKYALVIDKENNLTNSFAALQPTHTGYWELKKGIKKFADSMDARSYTYVDYPVADSSAFLKNLAKRLREAGYNSITDKSLKDSAALASLMLKYQAAHHLTKDGKAGRAVINSLNNNDHNKLQRYVITLDRFKLLPAQMPEKYIWVNLPSYNLKVWDNDTIALSSKIICGKPATSTPELTSNITNMILYPTWTVPASIIKKEMIPALTRDPGYLRRKGLYLLNRKREIVDPYSVNWSKYKNVIPFLVQQASGDDNALGVIKFNFNNPYAVYLHDTNQRYLFKNSYRAISHGCVRVQQWQELANYIARNDSMHTKSQESLGYNSDSIKNWLQDGVLRKIDVKSRMPLFIAYFGCEYANGKLVFYEDIYNEDRTMMKKYFASKN